ncbi:MAG: porin family protein [Rickettsiales bacterium]|nr:porin family protein [Rickettsiales bacterium]
MSPYIKVGGNINADIKDKTKSNNNRLGGINISAGLEIDEAFILGAEVNLNNKVKKVNSNSYMGIVGYQFKNTTSFTPYFNLKAGASQLSRNFGGKTFKKTNFAYGIGAGINYEIDENFSIGLEYSYMDMGKINTTITEILGISRESIEGDVHKAATLFADKLLLSWKKSLIENIYRMSFNIENIIFIYKTIDDSLLYFTNLCESDDASCNLLFSFFVTPIDVTDARYLERRIVNNNIVYILYTIILDEEANKQDGSLIESIQYAGVYDFIENFLNDSINSSFTEKVKVHSVSLNMKYMF